MGSRGPYGKGSDVNTEEGGREQTGIAGYNLSERGKGEILRGEGK